MHAFDHALPDAEKWLTKYYPAFKKVHKFDAAMLEGLIALDMVIVELPWNREIIGSSFDAAMAAYKAPTAAIAEKYDVPYLDFDDELDLPRAVRPLAPAAGGAGEWQTDSPASWPASTTTAPADAALMGPLAAGSRNRHPLILVVAALCLIPALLGFQWLFTSGACNTRLAAA